MHNSNADFIIEYFLDEHVDEIRPKIIELSDKGISVIVKKRESLIYASIEWALPTALALYVAKPFFESFLSEAGKDCYGYLKELISQALVNAKRLESNLAIATQPSGPTKVRNNTQSKFISVTIVVQQNVAIKFLFDKKLTTDEWILANEKMLQLVKENYKSYPQDSLTYQIDKLTFPNNLFAILNGNLEWQLYDGFKLGKEIFVEQQKNKQVQGSNQKFK
jgi:hypothetical protein